MNGQPDLSLGIEDTPEVTPCHCKTGLRFYCFQVARLSILKWTAKTGTAKNAGNGKASNKKAQGSESNSREREKIKAKNKKYKHTHKQNRLQNSREQKETIMVLFSSFVTTQY